MYSPCRWNTAEANPQLELLSNYGLFAAYSLITVIALVQLLRIQLRVPEYGWTTQKVFHLLNFIVCGLRAGTFLFRPQLENLHQAIARLALFDLPGARPAPLAARFP